MLTRTVWRIVRVPDWPARLDVTLSVDTTSHAVLKAIEQAAAANDVVLERVHHPDAHATAEGDDSDAT